jgi:four helix bundle protein
MAFSKPDFARFLRHAMGSLAEVETQLQIAHRLKYLNGSKKDELSAQCAELGTISGLIDSRLE